MRSRKLRAFTLIELLVVIVVIAILSAMLLSFLSTSRKSAIQSKLQRSEYGFARYSEAPAMKAQDAQPGIAQPPARRPLARVRSFAVDVELRPTLSVGTTEPESIYEAKFKGKITASQPANTAEDCEIILPLPPEIISLADLSVGDLEKTSDAVQLRDGKLVWHGKLPAEGESMDVIYTAMGRGLYSLEVPPGGIIDAYKIKLTTKGSDVRMLDLSLQPTSKTANGEGSSYTWDYSRIMFGRPIALDVLGVAPIDKLGPLTVLGPLSVAVFGIIIGLVAKAANIERFDRWMLLLTIGAFTGAYPLMYFAQEFLSLNTAIFAAGGLVLAIIALRTLTIMHPAMALAGFIIPAVAVMAVTLVQTVKPELKNILLTAEILALFVVAMVLIPRLAPTMGRHLAVDRPAV